MQLMAQASLTACPSTMQGMRVLDNACEIGIDKSERPMQLWKTLEQ